MRPTIEAYTDMTNEPDDAEPDNAVPIPIERIVHAERSPHSDAVCRIAYREGRAIRWAYAYIADLPWAPPQSCSAAVDASRPASMPALIPRPTEHRREWMREYQARRREATTARAWAMVASGQRPPRYGRDPEIARAYGIARRAAERGQPAYSGIT